MIMPANSSPSFVVIFISRDSSNIARHGPLVTLAMPPVSGPQLRGETGWDTNLPTSNARKVPGTCPPEFQNVSECVGHKKSRHCGRAFARRHGRGALRRPATSGLARVEFDDQVRLTSARRKVHPRAWACAATWRSCLPPLPDNRACRVPRSWRLPAPAPSRVALGDSSIVSLSLT